MYFCFCFFITFKASPPHPQKVHFYQLIFFFLNLPHFIKTLKYSLWNVCSVLCAPGRRPCPPFTRPGPPKVQGTSYPGLGGAGGTWVSEPLAVASRQPQLRDGGLPGPLHLLALPAHPPCKSMYLVRASLNSEVMVPGAPEPPGPDPSCASHPSRKAASSA